MKLNGKELPIIEIQGKINRRDFQAGYFLAQKNVSALHLPKVQAGLCLTGAAVCASMIPTWLAYFFSCLAPAGAACFFLALAGLFGFVIPSAAKSRGAALFASNQTLSLPYTVSFFPDRFVLENERESILEYWTDVELSLENKQYYVFKGNLEKPLVVIPKHGLTEKEKQVITELLQHRLVSRYRRAY